MASNNEANIEIPDYHPPGFTYDRLVNATVDEYLSIGEENIERFRVGLAKDKGNDALLQYEWDQRNADEQADRKAADPIELARDDYNDVLECVEVLLAWTRSWPEDQFPLWGFVIYRTAGYDSPEVWDRAKPVWTEIINKPFATYVERGAKGARDAQQQFHCRWIEGPDWDGATPEQVAANYRSIEENLPRGLRHNMCLCIDEASLRSFLVASKPTPACLQIRIQRTFILVVSIDAGIRSNMEQTEKERDGESEDGEVGSIDEVATWRGYFYTSTELITNEIFQSVANQGLTIWEIGGDVGQNEIWQGPDSASTKIPDRLSIE